MVDKEKREQEEAGNQGNREISDKETENNP